MVCASRRLSAATDFARTASPRPSREGASEPKACTTAPSSGSPRRMELFMGVPSGVPQGRRMTAEPGACGDYTNVLAQYPVEGAAQHAWCGAQPVHLPAAAFTQQHPGAEMLAVVGQDAVAALAQPRARALHHFTAIE